jgi:2',3'-cyclic-nucleotide 2'-phosphodiesterase (5'-nucleotidase family)
MSKYGVVVRPKGVGLVRLLFLFLVFVYSNVSKAHQPAVGSTQSVLNPHQNFSTECHLLPVPVVHRPSRDILTRFLKYQCGGSTKWKANRRDIDVKILYTADLHGHVEALSRISHLAKKEQRGHKSVVLLDCGDISVGTMFAKHYGAKAVSEAMNMVGYAAMGLGNHDTEYASELAVSFPVVSTNVAGFVPSLELTVGDVKIGLLAYTIVDDTEVQRREIEQRILETATCLRKSGADLVILIGHGMSSYNYHLAAQFSGIVDVVLGGHTHEVIGCSNGYLTGDVVLHPGTAGEFVGMLHVRRTAEKTSYHSRMLAVTHNLPEDPAVAQWLAPRLAALPQLDQPLAYLHVPLKESPRQCRLGACPTGSLVADAVRWHFNCSVVAMFEAGSIRDVLAGQLTQQELVHTLPWDNRMVLYQMTGATLFEMLQRSASTVQAGGGAHLQLAGVTYGALAGGRDQSSAYEVRTADGAQAGWRSLQGNAASTAATAMCGDAVDAPPQSEAMYTIAVTDWLASGGDGYATFLGSATRLPDSQQSELYAREMVAAYLQAAANWRAGDAHRRQNRLRSTLVDTFVPRPVAIPSDAKVNASPQAAPSSGMHSIIAILAEIPALIASHPLRTISTRQQSKVALSTQGLWNGATLSLTAVMLSKIIFWIIYYVVLDRIVALRVVGSALHQGVLSFCASIAGGAVEAIIMHPLWVIVVRQQVQHSNNANGTPSEKAHSAMFANLCDGLGFSLVLVLFPAARQSIFEYLLYVVDIVMLLQSTSFAQGMLGMCATMTATVLTYPLQTIRTQVQTGSFDCATLKPFAGLAAKLLAASVNAFVFFFCKKLLELALLN